MSYIFGQEEQQEQQTVFTVVDFNCVAYVLTLTGVDRAIKREH